MITNGSQHALDLIGKVFLNPGDTVLVEAPTHLGMIQAFTAYRPRHAAWVVHDLTHTAQIVRVMAERYRADMGPYQAYFGILKRTRT